MIYFFDTNIIMDFLLDSRKNFKVTHILMQEIKKRDSDMEIWIDRDSIGTINYLMRKDILKNEFTETIINSFNIASSTDILNESIAITKAENLDFEDVVKVKTAESIKANIFITEDKKLLNSDCFEIPLNSVEQMLVKFGFEKNLMGDFYIIPKDQRREIREKYGKLIRDADEGSVYILMEQMEYELKEV